MYRLIKTKKYLYTIEIKFNAYKFTLLPMVYIELLSNDEFKVRIGIWTLIAEFVKVRKVNKEDLKGFVKFIIDSVNDDPNKKEL